MNDQRIKYLAERFFQERASVEETHELAEWIAQTKNDKRIGDILSEVWDRFQPASTVIDFAEPSLERIREKLFMEYSSNPAPVIKEIPARRFFINRRWLPYAAAILIIIGTAAYLSQGGNLTFTTGRHIAATTLPVIKPGGNKAFLTLSDGTFIVLDSTKDGTLAQQANATIIKKDGQIIYNSGSVAGGSPLVYNTMSTPPGGNYQLKLQDGTMVWLNAASSITYPSSFTGSQRKVRITGEAYFEVSSDAEKPFIVEVNDKVQVEVLGTHFNINAYSDEPVIQTTLLEGSVRTGDVMLTPGQAWINGKVQSVNTESVIAWKNGLFTFNNADLKTVMRQLQRWYDIEVRFEGELPSHTFRGELKKNLTLPEIMEVLSYMEINYRWEGKRTLIISKK